MANIETSATGSIPAYNSRSSRVLQQVLRAIVTLPPAWVLIINGVLMAGIYMIAFTQRYSITEYGERPLQTIATLNRLSPEGALIFVAAFAALFGLYWLGLQRGLRPVSRSQWVIIGGFALLFNVLLLPMYPVDAADVYDYILRGRMAAVYDLNPMRDTPQQARQDPFFSFASYRDQPSAYGPAWEVLATVTSKLAGDDFDRNVLFFKLLQTGAYLLIGLLVALTLHELAPSRALPGFYLFLWNPLIVYMAGSGGHNDIMTMLFAMAGAYFIVRRWYIAATLAGLLGALIKFVPILIVPIVVILVWRQLRGMQRIRYFVVSALVGGLLIVGLYGLFGTGFDVGGTISRRTQMFTGSASTLLKLVLAPLLDGQSPDSANLPRTSTMLQYGSLALLGFFYLSQLENVYHHPEPYEAIRAVAATLAFHLLVTVAWFQPWYVIWLVAFGALLENGPMRRLILIFSYFALWQTFLYVYVTLRPGDWMPQPWRDVIPIFVATGTSWLYIAWFWISAWLHRAARSPLAVAVGDRLCKAREAAHLSIIALSDQLGMSTDELRSYEAGDRAIPLDKAEQLCQEIGLPVRELFPI